MWESYNVPQPMIQLEPGQHVGYVMEFEIHRHLEVWPLSSFEVSCHLSTNDLIQISSLSMLTTSSTAIVNFELTRCRHPLLTRAISLSFVETT